MKRKSEFSRSQNRIWQIGSVGSMIGIYFFLSTQVDVREPFVIGVYLVSSAVVVWACRRFVLDNVDENGRLKRKSHRDNND